MQNFKFRLLAATIVLLSGYAVISRFTSTNKRDKSKFKRQRKSIVKVLPIIRYYSKFLVQKNNNNNKRDEIRKVVASANQNPSAVENVGIVENTSMAENTSMVENTSMIENTSMVENTSMAENESAVEIPISIPISFSQPEKKIIEEKIVDEIISVGTHGLRNLGNTCYLNSALQSLFHTNKFTQNFLRLNNFMEQAKIGHMTSAILQILVEMTKSSSSTVDKSFSPKKILDALVEENSQFRGRNQQDSHEALISILSALSREEEEEKDNYQQDQEMLNNMNHMLLMTIPRIFGVQIRSCAVCDTCETETDWTEDYNDLSLFIPIESDDNNFYNSNKPISLLQCIQHFTNSEPIEEYFCSKCRIPNNAKKSRLISELNDVCIIHLERLQPDKKVTNHIHFSEQLDLSPFMFRQKDNTQNLYELYSVIVHDGSRFSGHYYCLCRDKEKWFEISDSTFYEVDIKKVLSSQAYILFYKKI